MKPARFEYFRPGTMEEASGLLQAYGPEAKILAGGQSLVPLMNFRLAQPRYLIDLGAIDELAFVREENGSVAMGAMLRQSAIEDSELLRKRCPLLVEATRFVGHRTIRNRGTIGGSLAHADPSAEYPAVLSALDGEVRAVGPAGVRTIPAREFFVTYCTTALAADEILTEVRLPAVPPRTGSAFVELSRRHGDYALVGAAAVVSLEDGRLCSDVRIALSGVGHTPMRCHEAEDLLRWSLASDVLIKTAAQKCSDLTAPPDDLHASGSYRKAMIPIFVERALRAALQRAEGNEP